MLSPIHNLPPSLHIMPVVTQGRLDEGRAAVASPTLAAIKASLRAHVSSVWISWLPPAMVAFERLRTDALLVRRPAWWRDRLPARRG